MGEAGNVFERRKRLRGLLRISASLLFDFVQAFRRKAWGAYWIMLECGLEVKCICAWMGFFLGLNGVLFEGVRHFMYVYKLYNFT